MLHDKAVSNVYLWDLLYFMTPIQLLGMTV